MICRAISSGSSDCHLLLCAVLADFARKGLVAEKDALREVEQRLPELVFDSASNDCRARDTAPSASCAARRYAVDVEHGFQARRCALGVALGEAAKLGEHRCVHRERIVRGKSTQPALGGLRRRRAGPWSVCRIGTSSRGALRPARSCRARSCGPQPCRVLAQLLRRKSLLRKRDDGTKRFPGQSAPPDGPRA